MSNIVNMFVKLDQTRRLVMAKADAAGLAREFFDGCEFSVTPFSDKGRTDGPFTAYVSCNMRTRGGLEVQFRDMFTEGTKVGTLEPEAYSETLVELAAAIDHNRSVHEQRKAEILTLFETYSAVAKAAGEELQLTRVTERPISAKHPNPDNAVYFDVCFVAKDHDGKLDTFSLDVEDADFLEGRLRHKVLPELGVAVPAARVYA